MARHERLLRLLALACALAEAAGRPGERARPEQRAEAALLGALVADAAAMPLHWIYDPEAIRSLLRSERREARPEFFPVPSSPFYKAAVGTQTPYGNQTLVLLRALGAGSPLAHPGEFLAAYARQSYDEFRDYSAHGWTDASTRGFVENYAAGLRWPACGAQDDQANALAHMVPAVAATWCLGEAAALDFVEKVIRTTQNADRAAAFGTGGARVLRRVILGESLASAVNSTVQALRAERERLPCCDGEIADRLEQAFRVRASVSHFEAVSLVGSSCLYPQNLVSGAHMLAGAAGPDFVGGVRSTILASGDQASRGMFLGAALGAAVGIPEEIPWRSQTRSAEEAGRLAKVVVADCHREEPLADWAVHV